MSKLYECLKNKATSQKGNNKAFYTLNSVWAKKPFREYTINDLYEAVNKAINKFKSINLTNKVCFHVVDTTFEDLVTIIALMETGNKPVLVNSDMLYDLYRTGEYQDNKDFPYKIIPSVNINNDEDVFIPPNCLLDIRPVDDEIPRYLVSLNTIADVLQKNFTLDDTIKAHDFDLAVLTSGTTGIGKVFKIKENELINKITKQYDLEKEETFICQNPISAISGLLFSLYVPIIGENKHIYVGNVVFTDYNKLHDHLHIILPGNYSFDNTYANKNKPLLFDSDGKHLTKKIDQISILGDRTSYEVIKSLHKRLKGLPSSKVFIYYGRTENMGLVSKIGEDDITPVYVLYSKLYSNKIIYTYNKVDVFEKEFIDNKVHIKKSNIHYNRKYFCEVLPIAIMNNPNEDIYINSNVYGEIISEGKKTNDYGFVLDNKIYYLCRGNELISLEDNQYFYVSAFEKNIEKSKYYDQKENGNVFICANNNKQINLYVPCSAHDYMCDNYRKSCYKLKTFFSQVNNYGTKVNNINLISSREMPYGREIGKIKRNQLLNLYSIVNPITIKNNNDYVNIVINLINKELKRNNNILYQNDYFIFNKKEFSSMDIAKIISIFKIFSYREDNDNYYLVINDEFLFAKDDNERNRRKKYCVAYDYLITNKQIMAYLSDEYKLHQPTFLKFGLYYDKDGMLTGVIDAITSSKVAHNEYYETKYVFYQNEIQKELYLDVSINQYELYKEKGYFDHVFKIDESDNLYCDGKLVKYNYMTPELFNTMHELLVNNKDLSISNMVKALK